MRALIIGGAGFVGNHLIRHLRDDKKWDVAVTKMANERIDQQDISIYDLNILERDSVVILLKEVRPDVIFHLAAQSSVALSWKNPDLTVDVNIKGSIHVLDAVRELDYSPRILLIGSGEEYGYVRQNEIPIKEENPLRPGNLYAATKICQNMIGSIYARAYGMDIMMVRAFNHVGPNQAPLFVVADFCKQVADIEKGIQEPVIRVGNLCAKRDFTDVRDVVIAYGMLVEKGKAGETYNIGSGNALSIEEILNMILLHTKCEIVVEIDKERLRPADVPVIQADTDKIKRDTGWEPKITLNRTIQDTLEYWRKQD